MTAPAARRAEALSWWQAGFAAGRAAARREHDAAAARDRAAAGKRQADGQARVETLLHEVIGILADGLAGRSPACPRCRRTHRSCQHQGERARKTARNRAREVAGAA